MVAACDLDANHLQSAVNTINDHYGNKDCKAYHDYRELLARDDIDAVMIAVPDHWHEIVATEAAPAQKGHLRRKAAGAHHRRAAIHCPRRSGEQHHLADGLLAALEATFHKAAEIVRNGLIGTVTHVEVGLPGGHHDFDGVQQRTRWQSWRAAGARLTSLDQVMPGTPRPGTLLCHRSAAGIGLRDVDRPIARWSLTSRRGST